MKGQTEQIEEQVSRLADKYSSEQISRYLNNLDMFLSRRHVNSSLGGCAKGANGYAKFEAWVKQTGFVVSDYRNSSASQFTIVLNRKGFRISTVTAMKYRKIYLSTQNF